MKWVARGDAAEEVANKARPDRGLGDFADRIPDLVEKWPSFKAADGVIQQIHGVLL
jgi:hypothetical protein